MKEFIFDRLFYLYKPDLSIFRNATFATTQGVLKVLQGHNVISLYDKGHTMKWKITNLQTFLYFLSAGILLVGLGIAGLIYQAAINDSNSNGGYEVVGGFIYPSAAENSKKYEHDLQLFGGQPAVIADKFMRWFAGLWHGESLAFTVACIAIILSFGVFLYGRAARARTVQGQ